MRKIHVALINNIRYCIFPEGVHNISDFAAFLNSNFHSFAELEFLIEDECVAPFFVEEELKTGKQFWNVSQIHHVADQEVTILPRCEYQERVNRAIQDKCTRCKHYAGNVCDLDDRPFAETIDLNGYCYGYERNM